MMVVGSRGLLVMATVVLAIALICVWRPAQAAVVSHVYRPFAAGREETSALVALAVAAAAMAARASGILGGEVQIMTLVCFAGLFAVACLHAGLPKYSAIGIGLLLYVAINDTWYHINLPIAVHFVYLIFSVLIAYVAVKPRGALVWLMPGTLLAHVSDAGLVALVILSVEILICLRRRHWSPLLGASLATVLLATLYTVLRPTDPLTSPGSTDFARLVSLLHETPFLWPGWVAVTAAALFGLFILFRNDSSWDPVTRAALLVAQAIFAVQIAATLQGAFSTTLIPGLYIPLTLQSYFVPFACVATVLSLTAWLAIRPAEAEAAPERPLRLLDPKWA
jgi:hypothetical protein